MKRHRGQRGAALILLLGIMAALAVFAASLVMVLANQQGATAAERSRKTSLYYAEGALDAAVSIAKAKTIPTTNSGSVWLPTSEVLAALEAAGFPEGAELKSFKVYDNLATVDYSIWWDSNLDDVVWIEVTITYQGKTTRLRALVSQTTQSVVKVFPKAVVYSDTGINLTGTSDVYAIEADGLGGTKPYVPASHGGVSTTTIMAGGGNYSAANAQDFDATTSANLAAPTSTAQSVNINVNGSVSPNTFSGTVIGGVGLLSDYFDQAAQADLGDEAQAGETHAAAPAVPTPTPSTTLSASAVAAIQDSSTTTPYTTYANTSVQTASGTSITITRTTARTLSFKDLYVRGNLSVTGPVTLNVSGYLRVDGTLRINNTTATAVTDTIGGALHVAGTGSSSVANRVTLSSASLYVGGPLTMSNIITTTGLLYAADDLSLTGNVTARTTALVVVGGSDHTDTDFGISGASSPVTDQFGPIWVAGKAVWSGAASRCQSTDYTNAAAKPAPMWIGILDRSGTFNDVYGPTWCVGNAGTSTVAVRFTGLPRAPPAR